jgi:KUP system potassium uptake protein
LDVWTKAAHPFIVPIAVLILIGLFLVQRRGTGRIGNLFGPIMLAWFAAIGLAGLWSVIRYPAIFAALDPAYAVGFFMHNGARSLLIFGAVVLCVTGCEALYADLAHFGRKPITAAWYFAVFPALLLNYFGQGAFTLHDPSAVHASFFTLVPRWGLVPMVFLATIATVIASQALISGVFSLTQQAMQLGFTPRFRIVHTSRHFAGQVYIPTINALLGLACTVLVVAFRSSERMGAAYGLAVTITMLMDTIAFSQLLSKRWRWPAWQWLPIIALFFVWEASFLIGNASKFMSGGWVPFAMALVLFTLFTTWNRGRRRLMAGVLSQTMTVDQFLQEAREPTVLSGTAFFLSPDPHGIPYVLHHQWLRRHIVYDTVVLLTIMHAPQPYVHPDKRVEIEDLTPRLIRAKAWYGFMQEPRIHDILHHLRKARPNVDFSQPTYYLAHPAIREDHSQNGLPNWQRNLFRWMNRNARPLTDSLGLPPNNVIEFGVEVKI